MMLLNEAFNISFTGKDRDLISKFVVKTITVCNNNKNNREQKDLVLYLCTIFPKIIYIEKRCVTYDTMIKIIVMFYFISTIFLCHVRKRRFRISNVGSIWSSGFKFWSEFWPLETANGSGKQEGCLCVVPGYFIYYNTKRHYQTELESGNRTGP